MTDEQVLAAFVGLRRARRGDEYAPHKPLLALLSLARVQHGEQRLAEFAQIEQPLKELLAEFGPSSAPGSRHYPFWHLATDGQGALWQLHGPAEILRRAPAATPNLTELKRHHVSGGFPAELHRRLADDPRLLRQVARAILDSSFPETLHEDIAQAVGLDLADDLGAEESRSTYTTTRRRRDPAFRDRVLLAYQYRCCVCGFDLRVGHLPAGVEAAHIKWHTAGGPDVTPNGLALCSLHHKLFDLGAFTVEPGELRVVFSQRAISSSGQGHGALAHHGAVVRQPQSADQSPAREFLAWNLANVFKTPRRELVIP
jgi:putative restriction endonuclease